MFEGAIAACWSDDDDDMRTYCLPETVLALSLFDVSNKKIYTHISKIFRDLSKIMEMPTKLDIENRSESKW